MYTLRSTIFRFSTKVGFIGLGNMGLPMAANLASKGYQVLGSDIDISRDAEYKKRGIIFTKDIKHIARNVNVCVTMLPNTDIVKTTCITHGTSSKN